MTGHRVNMTPSPPKATATTQITDSINTHRERKGKARRYSYKKRQGTRRVNEKQEGKKRYR